MAIDLKLAFGVLYMNIGSRKFLLDNDIFKSEQINIIIFNVVTL
jgi:hypothetical protein